MPLSAESIEAILVQDYLVVPGQLNFNLIDGVAYLRGVVPAQDYLIAIERQVKALPGVNAVINLLRVDFAKSLECAVCFWDPTLRGRLTVKVEDDSIHLLGETDTPRQMAEVEQLVRKLTHDWVVCNYLRPRPPITAVALAAALFERHPELRGQVIVADVLLDISRGGWLALAWSPAGEQAAGRIAVAIRGSAPIDIRVSVSTGPMWAMLLDLPAAEWIALFARHALKDHVVRVVDNSEYLSKAVMKSAQDNRSYREQSAELMKRFRRVVAQPGGPGTVYACIALLSWHAEQLAGQYESLPEGTQLTREQYSLMTCSILLRNVFVAAREAIGQNRGRWEQAGQLGELIIRVLDMIPRVAAIETARLAASWKSEGLTIGTAGIVKTMLAAERPRTLNAHSSAQQQAQGWRLSRALTLAAGQDKEQRQRALSELVAANLPCALEEWELKGDQTIERNLKNLRNKVSRLIERDILQPEKVIQLPDGIAGVAPAEEFLARQNAQGKQASEEELLAIRDGLRQAKLPPRQIEIMVLVADDLSNRAIATRLGITLGAVKKQRSRAQSTLRQQVKT